MKARIREFFTPAFLATAIPATAPTAPRMRSAHLPPSGPEVIGLFPEPGGG